MDFIRSTVVLQDAQQLTTSATKWNFFPQTASTVSNYQSNPFRYDGVAIYRIAASLDLVTLTAAQLLVIQKAQVVISIGSVEQSRFPLVAALQPQIAGAAYIGATGTQSYAVNFDLEKGFVPSDPLTLSNDNNDRLIVSVEFAAAPTVLENNFLSFYLFATTSAKVR